MQDHIWKKLYPYANGKQHLRPNRKTASELLKVDSGRAKRDVKRISICWYWKDTIGSKHFETVCKFCQPFEPLDRNDYNSIARHAFEEQKQPKLPWYTAVQALTQQLDPRKEYVEEKNQKYYQMPFSVEKMGRYGSQRSMEK